jgi:hypothetical protein
MNVKLIILLASLCLVLVCVILGEWLYARQTQAQLLAPVSVKPKASVSEDLPAVTVAEKSEDSYDDLVLKPLFVKGRKPVDEPGPEESQTATQDAVFDWALNGIYSKKGQLSALVSRDKVKVVKDNYRRIRIGNDLDGWRLTDIQNDRIVLAQGGTHKELLLRKPKPKQLPGKSSNSAPPVTAEQPTTPPSQMPPQPRMHSAPQTPEEPFETNIDEQEF